MVKVTTSTILSLITAMLLLTPTAISSAQCYHSTTGRYTSLHVQAVAYPGYGEAGALLSSTSGSMYLALCYDFIVDGSYVGRRCAIPPLPVYGIVVKERSTITFSAGIDARGYYYNITSGIWVLDTAAMVIADVYGYCTGCKDA